MTTFGRCKECMTLNWDSPMYMNTYGLTGCRRCGANKTRWPGKVTLMERLYLLSWFIWETWMINREDQKGDPDPGWWMNPMNILRVLWQGLHPDLSYTKKNQAEPVDLVDNREPTNDHAHAQESC